VMYILTFSLLATTHNIKISTSNGTWIKINLLLLETARGRENRLKHDVKSPAINENYLIYIINT
jgi:hypothetical protein